MKRILLSAILLSLAAVLPAIRAAEPVPLVAKVKPQSLPRGDSYGLIPAKAGEAEPANFTPYKREFKLEVPKVQILFLSRTRPIRIELTASVNGKNFLDNWNATLKELFAAFDRDGDGYLNKHEAELIFSLGEMKQLLASGFAYRGQQMGKLPTLAAMDKDGDGRVSFDEFAAYYDPEAVSLLRLQNLGNFANFDQLTPELFARLDTNGDGKLSKKELEAAEKILLALDSDEDECVSAQEILANPKVKPATIVPTDPRKPALPVVVPPGDVVVSLGALPGSIVQQMLKKYDTDGDFELSREEIGLSQADFDKIDTNRNGKISATELDNWRSAPADILITLDAHGKLTDCKATIAKGKGCADGIDLPKATNHQAILRIGSQTIDFAASAPPDYVRTNTNQYAYLIPQGKDYLEEKDLVGPQYQYVRLLFEPADFDGDGKLTRAELEKYNALQLKLGHLGTMLAHVQQTPSLFGLIDTNGDGRLSVRELRTAYARLLEREPTGGPDITKAILQPSLKFRLGVSMYGANDPTLYANQVNYYGGQNTPAPAKGPTWFRKMDRNGDGEVSSAEFLGSKEDFDAIDTDGDGYITLEEAEAYDAKSRKK